jgi:hypothetical protein
VSALVNNDWVRAVALALGAGAILGLILWLGGSVLKTTWSKLTKGIKVMHVQGVVSNKNAGTLADKTNRQLTVAPGGAVYVAGEKTGAMVTHAVLLSDGNIYACGATSKKVLRYNGPHVNWSDPTPEAEALVKSMAPTS